MSKVTIESIAKEIANMQETVCTDVELCVRVVLEGHIRNLGKR